MIHYIRLELVGGSHKESKWKTLLARSSRRQRALAVVVVAATIVVLAALLAFLGRARKAATTSGKFWYITSHS